MKIEGTLATWQPRPIFVCSTFQDMQVERDYLQNVIFPELDDWLHSHQLFLEPIDLRWGVFPSMSSDTTREAQILKVCLDAVDRCRPFFIIILGDRYGEVSAPERIKDALSEKGLSLDLDLSVTALEIEHAAFGDAAKDTQAFFYLRHPLPYSDMNPDTRVQYCDEGIAKKRLTLLKRRIVEKYPERTRRYSANWDDRGITGLENFGRMVLADLKQALGDVHVESKASNRPPGLEQGGLCDFVAQKSRGFVGRSELLGELLTLATGDADGGDGRPGICLTGQAGSGKSSLFAMVHQELAKHDVLILAYAAGATQNAAKSLNNMLRTWVRQLRSSLGVLEPADEEEPFNVLYETFVVYLSQASQERNVVLLVDGLDQFERTPPAMKVTWLPWQLPDKVRIIATTQPGDESRELSQLGWMNLKELQPLTHPDVRNIIQTVCGFYHKQLPFLIEQEIIRKTSPEDGLPAYGNPLWLKTVLEELLLSDRDAFDYADRTFKGSPEHRIEQLMLEMVRSFPPQVDGLYQAVLRRGERNYGKFRFKAFTDALAASRSGLREGDLLGVVRRLSDRDVQMLDIAIMRRGFRGHLILAGDPPCWNIAHHQLRLAIRKRNTTGRSMLQKTHKQIANHLRSLPVGDPVRNRETMFHELGTGDPRQAAYYFVGLQERQELNGARNVLAEYLIEGERYDANPAIQWIQAVLSDSSFSAHSRQKIAHSCLYQVADMIRNDAQSATLFCVWEACQTFLEKSYEAGALDLDRREMTSVLNKLGNLMVREGHHTTEALELHKRARRFAVQRYDENSSRERLSEVLTATTGLADLLARCGYREDARTILRHALEELRSYSVRAGRPEKPWLAVLGTFTPWQDLGRDEFHIVQRLCDLALIENDVHEALDSAKRALDWADFLHALVPDTQRERDLLNACTSMGSALLMNSEHSRAQELYERAFQISQRRYRERPDRQTERDLATSLQNMGELERLRGAAALAVEYFERAVTVDESLFSRDPSPQHRRNLSQSCERLGTAALKSGNPNQALTYYMRSFELREGLYENFPTLEYGRDLSDACKQIASVLVQLKRYGESKTYLQRALEIDQSLNVSAPGVKSLTHLISTYDMFGALEGLSGKSVAAAIAFKKSFELTLQQFDRSEEPAVFDTLSERGDRLLNQLALTGDLGQATAILFSLTGALRRWYGKQPSSDLGHRWLHYLDLLCAVERKLGRLDDARSRREEAIAVALTLHEQYPEVEFARNLTIQWNYAGDEHMNEGDDAGATAYYQKAMDLRKYLFRQNPSAESARDLSISCDKLAAIKLRQEDVFEAIKLYERALTLDRYQFTASPSADSAKEVLLRSTKFSEFLQSLGFWERAASCCKVAVEVREKLQRVDPTRENASELNRLHQLIIDLNRAHTGHEKP